MSPYGFAKGELSTVDNYLLSIPFRIKYDVEIINMNIMFNIEPSYLLKSKIKSPSQTISYTLIERDVTDEMKRIQFALGLGIEYVITIFDKDFGINTIYNLGLTSLPKKGEFTDSFGTHQWVDYKTSELILLLSYYF
jgi:hypothetical protein